MQPLAVYTLIELQRIVPNFRTAAVHSEDPKVIDALQKLFWKLGCDYSQGVEIQYDQTTKNRFGEDDTSPRFLLKERIDFDWTCSPHASVEAKQYTKDMSLLRDLNNLKRKGF